MILLLLLQNAYTTVCTEVVLDSPGILKATMTRLNALAKAGWNIKVLDMVTVAELNK